MGDGRIQNEFCKRPNAFVTCYAVSKLKRKTSRKKDSIDLIFLPPPHNWPSLSDPPELTFSFSSPKIDLHLVVPFNCPKWRPFLRQDTKLTMNVSHFSHIGYWYVFCYFCCVWHSWTTKNAFSHKNEFNIFKNYGIWRKNDDHLEKWSWRFFILHVLCYTIWMLDFLLFLTPQIASGTYRVMFLKYIFVLHFLIQYWIKK